MKMLIAEGMNFRKIITIANFTVAFLSATMIVLTAIIENHYEEAILFCGTMPYKWGTTSSMLFIDAVDPFFLFYLFVFLAVGRIIYEMHKEKDNLIKTSNYILCAILATIPIIRYLRIVNKYDDILYDVNDAMLASNGEYIRLGIIMRIPIVIASIVIIVLVIGAVSAHKYNICEGKNT